MGVVNFRVCTEARERDCILIGNEHVRLPPHKVEEIERALVKGLELRLPEPPPHDHKKETPLSPVVYIARCPECGLHGERSSCFECGGEVEQVAMVTVEEVEALREELAAANTELGLRRSRKVLNLELEAKVDKLEAELAMAKGLALRLPEPPLHDHVKEPSSQDLCANCEHPRAFHHSVDKTCSYQMSFGGVTCTCDRFETTEEHIDRMTAAIDPIGAARAHGSGQSVDPRASDRVGTPVLRPRDFNLNDSLVVARACFSSAELAHTKAELIEIMNKNISAPWELLSYTEDWVADQGHYHVRLTGRSAE